MSVNSNFRIENEAAKALIEWKAQFAEEVYKRARELAIKSEKPHTATLSHYRQAAELALQSLSNTIRNGDPSDVERNAA
ncbi:hypothetical protein [Gimesia fumaroli]|uniref:Uncharacterized protein n=1 Tax=Gimesia fumaroli TaxID=2527976 RepID=A0A518IFA9_9PLAN|nr:hypothetical protein [Gimesia fumaroli]QDV51783.1 hypothetical protein Enr17x_38410 [Gimesia fumaroli]